MSAFKAAIVECDGCGKRYGPENYATLEGIRARAKARGWLTRVLVPFRDSGIRFASDFCPRCVKGKRRRGA